MNTLYHESSLAAKQMKFNEITSDAISELLTRDHELHNTLVQLSELMVAQGGRIMELEEKVDRLERGT